MIVNLEKDIWTLRFQDQKLLSLAKRLYFIAYFTLIIPVTIILIDYDTGFSNLMFLHCDGWEKYSPSQTDCC